MAGSNQELSFAWPRYPLDKIFYKVSGSKAVTQSGFPTSVGTDTVTITNPESTTFFLDLQVSPDGIVWYDSGLEPYYLSGGQPYKRFGAYWYMTSSTITIKLFANDASYTLYYRAIGYSKD
jgi:hypothetical protein